MNFATNRPVSPARDQAKFRTFALVVSGFLTAIWAALVIGGMTETLPFERGYGNVVAVVASVVFVIFVLPALLLAIFNRIIGLAFALAILGLVCYAYPLVVHLTTFLGN
jgi:hypothetical protein